MTDFRDFRGAARPLDDIDLPRLGHRLGVGEDEIHAVIDVEAAGGAWDARSRPKMLFEPHRFYKNLGPGPKRDQAVRAGLAYARWGEKAYPKDSYPRLVQAMAIDKTAALKSASWGLGQILGENFAMVGYDTVQAMVLDTLDDADKHLEMMVNFILAAKLDGKLRAHDWTAFARGYNGPQHAKHDYAGRLRRAYARWAKIVDTPWSPETEIVHVPVPTPRPVVINEPPARETQPPLIIGHDTQVPAPIGHNGGPALETPPPATGGPRAKANGAGLGVLIVAPALALMVRFGWIPADVASDPETVVQLTALALAAAAYAGAWLAPKNAAS